MVLEWCPVVMYGCLMGAMVLGVAIVGLLRMELVVIVG
jgi:hypothetical protein